MLEVEVEMLEVPKPREEVEEKFVAYIIICDKITLLVFLEVTHYSNFTQKPNVSPNVQINGWKYLFT